MVANAVPLVPRGLDAAALLLGIALGGFFDGILLHQILQWHHLLSGLQGGAFEDIRVQLLADGIFHVLMYLLAIWGLVLIWHTRQELGRPQSGYRILANSFVGFGAWHIIDGVVSHWVLGIHRIRMDADNPLFWDVLWFAVFGIAFVAIGWFIHWRGGDRSGGSPKPIVGILIVVTLLMAPMAAIPSQQENTVLVFFDNQTRGVDIFRAAEAAQARIIWSSAGGKVWAMEVSDNRGERRLAEHGAYWIVSSPALIGCMAWATSRTS
jgi:uncharacterized membrane protein